MINGESKQKSSSVVAIEHVAYRMSATMAYCLLSVIVYLALGRSQSFGAIGFLALEVGAFAGAIFMCNVLICYVRFGKPVRVRQQPRQSRPFRTSR